MRAVRDSRGVERDRLRPHAAPAREVAANVVDQLVAVDGGVRVGAGDRLGVEIRHAGNEGADEDSARGERGVDRRREVDEARLRLVRKDRECERPDRAIPSDDVERRFHRRAADVPIALLDEDLPGAGSRAAERGALEVAVSIGSVHPELADRVAELRGNVKAAPELERDSGEPLEDPPAMDDAPRNENVVPSLDVEVSERRLEGGPTRIDVEQVVTVAVGERGIAGRIHGELEERDDDVGVAADGSPPDRRALAEDEPATERLLGSECGRLPVQGAGLGGTDRPVGHRRTLVVEDRKLAVEADPGEALLVAEPARGRSECDVGLRRHLAELHPVDHLSPRPRGGSDRRAGRTRSTRRGP